MMSLQEGRAALEYGVSPAIKEFSEAIIKDQEVLLEEISKLAALKKLDLPVELSPEKVKDLNFLNAERGKEFENQFIKLMVLEHRKDVRYFKMAMEFQDPDMRAFASKYLPLVESHLESAKALKH